MKFIIEPEDQRGGSLILWIVKCVEKGKIVAMHRFYRSGEGYLYHRGDHDEHELPAQKTLEDYLKDHPEMCPPAPTAPHTYSK